MGTLSENDVKKNIGQRIKQGRARLSLSMEALCEKINGRVTKQAISKYEKGLMMPDSTVLILLAEVFGEPLDFFFRPIELDYEKIEISFRKKAKITGKQLEALKANIQDDVERRLEIDEILGGIAPVFSQVLSPTAKLKEPSEMIKCAQSVRDQWRLGIAPIGNVQTLLESNGITVIVSQGSKDFDGVSAIVNGKPIMVLNENVDMYERQRFTAMHELGHILFNDLMDENLKEKQREDLCNAFANEMLLPSSILINTILPSRFPIEELIDLQKEYGISIDAIMNKLNYLKIVSGNRYTSYYKFKNANPAFKASVEKSRFSEKRIPRMRSKVYSALAKNLITESKAAALLKVSVEEVHKSITIF